jgi:hypothetical protein
MNRWTGGLRRVLFAFLIVFLAGFLTVLVRAMFHFQNNRITGMTFLLAVVGMCFVFERAFPAVYSRRRPTQWWQNRGVMGLAFVIVVGILSSWIATLWLGLVVVSGALVALLLHVTAIASQAPTLTQKAGQKDVG